MRRPRCGDSPRVNSTTRTGGATASSACAGAWISFPRRVRSLHASGARQLRPVQDPRPYELESCAVVEGQVTMPGESYVEKVISAKRQSRPDRPGLQQCEPGLRILMTRRASVAQVWSESGDRSRPGPSSHRMEQDGPLFRGWLRAPQRRRCVRHRSHQQAGEGLGEPGTGHPRHREIRPGVWSIDTDIEQFKVRPLRYGSERRATKPNESRSVRRWTITPWTVLGPRSSARIEEIRSDGGSVGSGRYPCTRWSSDSSTYSLRDGTLRCLCC